MDCPIAVGALRCSPLPPGGRVVLPESFDLDPIKAVDVCDGFDLLVELKEPIILDVIKKQELFIKKGGNVYDAERQVCG